MLAASGDWLTSGSIPSDSWASLTNFWGVCQVNQPSDASSLNYIDCPGDVCWLSPPLGYQPWFPQSLRDVLWGVNSILASWMAYDGTDHLYNHCQDDFVLKAVWNNLPGAIRESRLTSAQAACVAIAPQHLRCLPVLWLQATLGHAPVLPFVCTSLFGRQFQSSVEPQM